MSSSSNTVQVSVQPEGQSFAYQVPGEWTHESSLGDIFSKLGPSLSQYDCIVEGQTIPHDLLKQTTLASLLPDHSFSILLCPKTTASKKARRSTYSLSYLAAKGPVPLNKDNKDLQSSTHTKKTGHNDADIVVEPINLCVERAYLAEDEKEAPSLLLASWKDEFRYQTEADIQNYVWQAVSDALKMLGKDVYDHFTVSLEVSLFSYRPDIVVVHHSVLGIVLVVEVKKPGETVFSSKEVGGQVFDYLLGQASTGVATPFAVLSTYEKMVIAHRGDCKTAVAESKAIIDHEARNLHTEFILPEVVTSTLQTMQSSREEAVATPPMQERSEAKLSSPGSEFSKVLQGINRHEVQEAATESYDDDADDAMYYPPKVYYSQTFGLDTMIAALVLALRCGFASLSRKSKKDLPRHGGSTQGTCAYVNAKALVWKDIPETINFNYLDFPSLSTKSFYLWASLGRGSTGRSFLACNGNGRVCVLKFFLIDEKRLRQLPKEERPAALEEDKTKTKKKAIAEMQYWKEIYGKDEVRVVELNQLWCLMMPYYDPVLKQERHKALEPVRQLLISFQKKSLQYNDNDLRWRHIRERDGQIILIDLGSLEKCDSTKINVNKQIQFLKDTM